MNVQRSSLLAGAEQVQGLPIIIDVLRAFTTSAVLFSLGIESLILVSTAEEAFALHTIATREHWSRVIVVTSKQHTRRARLEESASRNTLPCRVTRAFRSPPLKKHVLSLVEAGG